jgi:hypothetical protein
VEFALKIGESGMIIAKSAAEASFTFRYLGNRSGTMLAPYRNRFRVRALHGRSQGPVGVGALMFGVNSDHVSRHWP